VKKYHERAKKKERKKAKAPCAIEKPPHGKPAFRARSCSAGGKPRVLCKMYSIFKRQREETEGRDRGERQERDTEGRDEGKTQRGEMRERDRLID
jgi:hypothetical protein